MIFWRDNWFHPGFWSSLQIFNILFIEFNIRVARAIRESRYMDTRYVRHYCIYFLTPIALYLFIPPHYISSLLRLVTLHKFLAFALSFLFKLPITPLDLYVPFLLLLVHYLSFYHTLFRSNLRLFRRERLLTFLD